MSWGCLSVLPFSPALPKTTGQVLGFQRNEILCHWESPGQQIQSDSVGTGQLEPERKGWHGTQRAQHRAVQGSEQWGQAQGSAMETLKNQPKGP